MASKHPNTQSELFETNSLTKRCTKCGEVKPLAEYAALRRGRYLMAECRVCNRLRQREWSARNRARNKVNPPSEEGQKRCSICGETKRLYQFTRWFKNKGGFMYSCKPCRAKEKKAWEERLKSEPEVMKELRRHKRELHRMRKYGLADGEYDAMHAAQNGLCAICGKPETARSSSGGSKGLGVDHCHKTGGKIRALLCCHCNQGIGHFFDDPNLLRVAAVYLEKHATG